jgi:uncharacterized protein (DUF433 family)
MIETTETTQSSAPTGPVPSVLPPKSYIEVCRGAYRIAGTRISLDSVVWAFREGLSPETIQRDCFSSLTLEQVYGAITFYLAHQAEIDAYLEAGRAEYEAARLRDREADPEFYQKLAAARQRLQPQDSTP